MAKPNYAFEKRQRELAKKKKKEEKKQQKATGPGGRSAEPASTEQTTKRLPADHACEPGVKQPHSG